MGVLTKKLPESGSGTDAGAIDWPAIEYHLSRQFGWTPQEIDRITLQQMEHYLEESVAYRATWPEPDVTLEKLRQVLWSFFDVKEQPSIPLEQQARQLANPDGLGASLTSGVTLTQEEFDAFVKAGMPSPFTGWLEGFRNERRRRESPPDSGSEELHHESH